MPYIPAYLREPMESDLDTLQLTIKTDGELNYAISMLMYGFFKRAGADYQAGARAVAAAECAKLEFYRRIMAPYEGQKLREHGDIYAD